jgi:hypothetical protein
MSFVVHEISFHKGLEDFLSVATEVYRKDPNWIPPQISELKRVLNPLKNPYFLDASLRIYVCYSDGRPVSRAISVMNHNYWTRWNRKSVFFGFFESINDIRASRVLFEKIETDSKACGVEYIEGPFNPNHYSELGILTDNFDAPPSFFETYNPSYYPSLLNDAGFFESNRFHTRINKDISTTLSKKYPNHENESGSSRITVRKFSILRFKRDLNILREINNDAFANNRFFLPLSIGEYRFSARYLFLVTSPSLILIAERNGIPVGAAQFVINFNKLIRNFKGTIMPWHVPVLLWKRRNLKELIVFTTAVKQSYRKTRVFACMLKSAVEIFRKYSSISTTWISDESLGTNLDILLDMKPGKHFVIFSKQL